MPLPQQKWLTLFLFLAVTGIPIECIEAYIYPCDFSDNISLWLGRHGIAQFAAAITGLWGGRQDGDNLFVPAIT